AGRCRQRRETRHLLREFRRSPRAEGPADHGLLELGAGSAVRFRFGNAGVSSARELPCPFSTGSRSNTGRILPFPRMFEDKLIFRNFLFDIFIKGGLFFVIFMFSPRLA